MAETLRGEVIHVVAPDEQEEYDLDGEVRSMAESRYLLVCRKGGTPTWGERIRAFMTRRPIEAVTLVAETAVEEGQEVTATVEETGLAGVYRVTELQ